MKTITATLISEEDVSDAMGTPKLTKRFIKNNIPLCADEITDIVTAYYDYQKKRISTNNKISALTKENKKSFGLQRILADEEAQEYNMKLMCDVYTDIHPIGKWLKSIAGIGPVISAGLLTGFNIHKAPCASSFWKYAGIDVGRKDKGKKIDFSPKMKTLCWKVGQGFVKINADKNPNGYYRRLYQGKKKMYLAKSEDGGFAEDAKFYIETKNFNKDTDAYKAYSTGKFPLGHIDQMAQRYATKMLLSHLFEVMYIWEYGEEPNKPYAIEFGGHVHQIHVPNKDIIAKDLLEKWGADNKSILNWLNKQSCYEAIEENMASKLSL